MGSVARQDGSSATAMRQRTRAWLLIVLGLATTVAIVLAALVFGLCKFAGVVDGFRTTFVNTSLSEAEAKEQMAHTFHLHIPDNWRLIQMASSCQHGVRLNSCVFNGSFTGPAAEFDRYPELFRAQPPDTIDLPPAQPITCDGLAAQSRLGLADGLDCAAQQHLAVSHWNIATSPGGTVGDVLIAGSSTATVVNLILIL
ncbi:hypothetical protein [Nocardia tengchongensis]|uniref:hypothetical protein n=1 Tax=Nocardia tengchongensis TaxID=2055889 RepID=UPI0036AF6335